MDFAFLTFHSGGRATTQSLTSAITQAVDSGLLLPGDKMPSTREIGRALGISRTVVVRAFDQLIARGYLSAVKGSGTVVASSGGNCADSTDIVGGEHIDFSPSEEREFAWQDHYSEKAKYLTRSANQSAIFHDVDHQPDYGVVPAELLPIREWVRISSSICRNGTDQNWRGEQTEVFGYRPLRIAIAQFLRRTKGIVCDPEQIVLYSGPQVALAHITDLLVAPGQLAVCENPGYPGARKHFQAHGAEVMKVPVDENGLVTEVLKALPLTAHWLYTTPSCQDPTGAVLSETRREELLEWCWTTQTAIIEDAWDSDFRYRSASPAPLFAMDTTGSVIYLYNFWRLLCPLSSLGVAVLPEALVDLFKTSKYLSDRHFPTIEHYVLTELLQSGYLIRHIRNTWKIYRSRRQSLIFWLKRMFTERVEIVSQGAGMQFIIRLRGGWTQEQVFKAAAASGLPVASTARYYFDRAPRNEFVVNFARIPGERAEEVVTQFLAGLTQAGSGASVAMDDTSTDGTSMSRAEISHHYDHSSANDEGYSLISDVTEEQEGFEEDAIPHEAAPAPAPIAISQSGFCADRTRLNEGEYIAGID